MTIQRSLYDDKIMIMVMIESISCAEIFAEEEEKKKRNEDPEGDYEDSGDDKRKDDDEEDKGVALFDLDVYGRKVGGAGVS